jgi:hypothetical protein
MSCDNTQPTDKLPSIHAAPTAMVWCPLTTRAARNTAYVIAPALELQCFLQIRGQMVLSPLSQRMILGRAKLATHDTHTYHAYRSPRLPPNPVLFKLLLSPIHIDIPPAIPVVNELLLANVRADPDRFLARSSCDLHEPPRLGHSSVRLPNTCLLQQDASSPGSRIGGGRGRCGRWRGDGRSKVDCRRFFVFE